MRKTISDSEMMEILGESYAVLEDKKALETVVMDLSRVNSYFEYFIIATGSSLVHCKSLARDLRKSLNARGLKEGMKPDMNSGWIILDFNGIIVHVFTEELREYYQLEKLWADAERIEFEEV